MTRPIARGAAIATALCASVACQPRTAQDADGSGAAPCEAVTGSLAPGTEATRLAGSWSVTLVATDGPHAGRSVAGLLALVPFDSAAPYAASAGGTAGSNATYPLHGRLGVALDSIGAPAPGADTANPDLPGVLAVAWNDPPPASGANITLRLGAEANRPGVVRFDGAFTALHLTALTDSTFAGTWVTGGAQPSGGGHFCAARR